MAEYQPSKPWAADILVLDDDIASLRRLAGTLSREGYRVRQADGPDVDLQAALAHLPDLILLSVVLHGVSAVPLANWYARRLDTADPGARN